MDGRDWILLGGLSVLWGGSFFFNGVALRELPPFTLVFLRVALAATILLPVLRIYQIDFPRGFRVGGRFSASRFSTTSCRSR